MTFSNTLTIFAALAAFTTTSALAGDPFHSEKAVLDECAPYWDSHRVDSHAPIGVMGEHTHEAGEIMTSYRYMFMNMAGMRDGTDSLTSEQVFQRGFPVSPTKMSMEMHMLGLMFAPTDSITLMLMANLVSIEMDHVTRPGSPPRRLRGESFTTRTEDWGDTKLVALVKVQDCRLQRIHLHFGVSAPTGEIDAEDPGPLPYPMQTGSGTWDLITGASWLRQTLDGNWSYGAQALGTIRLDDNHRDYSLGDRVDATFWLTRVLSERLSISGRLGWTWNDDIEGADPRLNQRLVPTAVPDHFGRQRIDASLGINWYAKSGHRLAVEAGVPLYEDISGPLLENDYWMMIGWQKAW
ncbi:MAG: hypothetical protein ACI8UO_006785 [Verrucomicrobiales bacterium]|jgi:hypothetical protein